MHRMERYALRLNFQGVSRVNLCRNIFGLGGKTKKEEPAEKVLTEKEKKVIEESLLSTNYNLKMLKKNVSLTTKKGYKPLPNVEEIIEKIVEQNIKSNNWRDVSLKDPTLKFKLLSTIITELKHDIPNNELNNLTNVTDILNYFQTEISETSTYEDLASGKKTELPKNLHIQLEALRFHPEEDTMFGGRTAFPGSDTIVPSLKYRRKYEGHKGSKEKPGFNNYYYDY